MKRSHEVTSEVYVLDDPVSHLKSDERPEGQPTEEILCGLFATVH
jgi:hypothetical protein